MRFIPGLRATTFVAATLWLLPSETIGQGRPIRTAPPQPGQPITTPTPTPTPTERTDFERFQTRLSTGLRWIPLDVPDFPPGALVAVVHGDPNVRNRDYVIRIRFPAGYRFPVRWHEESEHITVLQGSFLFAIGDVFDESLLQRYGPGDFVYAPARVAHFGGARVPTVIQVHGIGPFRMNLGAAPIRD